jgi:hypothetical protein
MENTSFLNWGDVVVCAYMSWEIIDEDIAADFNGSGAVDWGGCGAARVLLLGVDRGTVTNILFYPFIVNTSLGFSLSDPVDPSAE